MRRNLFHALLPMRSQAIESGNMLLVDEFFATEDDRFLTELRKLHKIESLVGLAERWKKDPRPWARQQIIKLLELPLSTPGHQPIVKRLFKQAEQNRDHELMAAFLVAFDRLLRLKRATLHRYDWQTQQSWTEERLVPPRDVIYSPRKGRNPRTGWQIEYESRVPKQGRLFRHPTRRYLRRRAWRYFRRLGFQRPAEYCAAVAAALRQYTDDDLNPGENLLESWGPVYACFHKHPALQFSAHRIELQIGHTLSELTPSPYFPALWQQPEAMPLLLALAGDARSRLVRVWSLQLLRRDHAGSIAALPVAELLKLLESRDQEVQQFALELLDRSPSLGKLPLEDWLKLVHIQDPIVQSALCDLMQKHVSRERLTLRQCVELACAEALPLARLGFSFVKATPISTAADRTAIAELARAECSALGAEIAIWALPHFGTQEHYDRDMVTSFFDSLLDSTRAGTWQWLLTNTIAQQDAALFARLIETPYDDVRLRLVDYLQNRADTDLPKGGLLSLCAMVLVGVHRGGRQKLKAIHQLMQAVTDGPYTDFDYILEVAAVLHVAFRSIRGPERRAALSAIFTAIEKKPELAIHFTAPDLKLIEEAV